jgi:hypothetical protein
MAMEHNMNDLTLAGTLITSPGAAFAELRERPRFWLPLIALILALAIQQFWYYSIVDFAWLKDHMFGGNERFDSMTPEQRERAMSMMSHSVMMWSSVISVAVVMPIVLALISAYYLLAGKVTNVQYTFKQWFSFSSWCSVPMLVGIAASYAILAMQGANAQIGPSELQVLSANELFFQLPPSHSGAQMLMQLNPMTIWTWVIGIIGDKVWSKRTWVFSATFVMLPSVLIYGVWALIAF